MKIALETRVVEEEAFGKVLSFIAENLTAFPEGDLSIQALLQDLHWFGGRIDRLGITDALFESDRTRPERRSIAGLPREMAMRCALTLTGIQCANSLNRPLNIACMDLAARSKDQETMEARAYFLPGSILVIPDDDFAIEARLQAPQEDADPPLMGTILLAPAPSNHAQILRAGAARAAADLLLALLARPDLEVSAEIWPGDAI